MLHVVKLVVPTDAANISLIPLIVIVCGEVQYIPGITRFMKVRMPECYLYLCNYFLLLQRMTFTKDS